MPIGIRDPLEAGPQQGRYLAAALALAPLGVFDRQAKRAGENEIEMMTAARPVAERDKLAVLYDADPGRPAADIDDRAVPQLEQRLRR